MKDLTPPYCPWMREVCNLLEEEKTEQGLDLLYQKIDELLFAKEFSYVDGFLQKPIVIMNIDLILGLLTITLAAKENLIHRRFFYREAIGELVGRVGWASAQQHLEGLE